METTTLYLSTELMAAYTTLAQKTDRPTADLIREALATYVEHQNHDLPDWIGMLDVEYQFDSTTVKAWLLENRDLD